MQPPQKDQIWRYYIKTRFSFKDLEISIVRYILKNYILLLNSLKRALSYNIKVGYNKKIVEKMIFRNPDEMYVQKTKIK